jgi:hypothetical protein
MTVDPVRWRPKVGSRHDAASAGLQEPPPGARRWVQPVEGGNVSPLTLGLGFHLILDSI